MVRAVVIDDEEDARYVLRTLIEQEFNGTVKVVGEADDVVTGVALIDSTKPDLVLLDIRMKTGTGFDLLDKIDKKDFETVFITAYNSHALRAFEYLAMGYILKPVDREKFKEVFTNALSHIERGLSISDETIESLKNNLDEGQVLDKIVISDIKGYHMVEIDSIVRLQSDRNYTKFYLSDGKEITATRNLGKFERILTHHNFLRCHQSHLVNLDYVKSYLREDGGVIEMIDGKKIVAGSSKKQDLLKRFYRI